jgi:thiosulfate/3-mercaptopyruvate sulfurtransferase
MTEGDNPDDGATTRRGLLAAAAAASVGSTAGCAAITTPADTAAETSVGGNVGYFVGGPWLADNRGDVTVLDARPRELYEEGRIYGAQHVPLERLTERAETERGLVPDTDAIAEAFGSLGVAPEEDVVVYGDSVGARVTRTVFGLLAVGHDGEIRILNGGFDAWNGRIGTGSGGSPSPVAYEPDPQSDLWVDRTWLADRVGTFNDDGPGLVDVREAGAYLANMEGALDPDNDRHGHLPGAVNVHWLGNIDSRQIRDPGDLFELYSQDGGIDPSGVVVYGNENVDPTQTWVTLRAIGFDDVRLYDGGFGEWSNVETNRGRFPVEIKTTVVVETEGGGGGSDGSNFTCTA